MCVPLLVCLAFNADIKVPLLIVCKCTLICAQDGIRPCYFKLGQRV